MSATTTHVRTTEVDAGTATSDPRTVHPDFCVGQGDPAGCDLHLGEATVVAATARRPHAACDGAVFPAFSVSAAVTEDGTRGVALELFAPDRRTPVLRDRELDELIAALIAQKKIAEVGS